MKVLILSCNTGEGHNYAGRALKECIESHHDTADMLDIMMLASPRVSKLVGNSYVNIVRHAPRLFQCLYKPVSYTHLDVYKRQHPDHFLKYFFTVPSVCPEILLPQLPFFLPLH